MKNTLIVALLVLGTNAAKLKHRMLAQLAEVPDTPDAAEHGMETAPGLQDNQGLNIANSLDVASNSMRYYPSPPPCYTEPDSTDSDYSDHECPEVSCPYNEEVKCAYLHTDLMDAVHSSADENEGAYGSDFTPAVISSQRSGAYSHQGENNEAIPDQLKKINAVENGEKRANSKERDDYSGRRTKTFTIAGQITIDEEQCGGLCEAKNSCESDTGDREVQALTRWGNAEAEVSRTCSRSGPASGCGCGCGYGPM